MIIYIVKRKELDEGYYKPVREAFFSTRKNAIEFLNKLDIYKNDDDYTEYIEEYELDKLKNIKGYFRIIFECCQSCLECSQCWKRLNYLMIKDFNVKVPLLENQVMTYITKVFENINDDDVKMYDEGLRLEVTSYEKDKESALKDAINKAKIWIEKNQIYIDSNTNWLNERERVKKH